MILFLTPLYYLSLSVHIDIVSPDVHIIMCLNVCNCFKDRLPDSRSCLNLFPCVIKKNSSLSLSEIVYLYSGRLPKAVKEIATTRFTSIKSMITDRGSLSVPLSLSMSVCLCLCLCLCLCVSLSPPPPPPPPSLSVMLVLPSRSPKPHVNN